VRRNIARSREHAGRLIEEGRVLVDGSVATKPATGVTTDAAVVLRASTADDAVEYVSRGGHKLAGALDRLESFVSLNGPAFHGLPPNEERTALQKGAPWTPPASIATEDGPVTVFDPGFPLHWRLEESSP